MEMNLKILRTKPKLIKQIAGYIDKNKAVEARSFMDKYFPSTKLRFCHDRIILEIADVLLSIVEDDESEYIEYMKDIRKSANSLITNYQEQKRNARDELTRTINNDKTNYMLLNMLRNIEERAELDYGPETIERLLAQMDAREKYNSYVDGYEYERYIAYSWLKTEITNTLSDNTHEVVKNLNKPYDEK